MIVPKIFALRLNHVPVSSRVCLLTLLSVVFMGRIGWSRGWRGVHYIGPKVTSLLLVSLLSVKHETWKSAPQTALSLLDDLRPYRHLRSQAVDRDKMNMVTKMAEIRFLQGLLNLHDRLKRNLWIYITSFSYASDYSVKPYTPLMESLPSGKRPLPSGQKSFIIESVRETL